MNTNAQNYKRGFIYHNPEDSRIMVPKISPSMGWPLSFANWITYIIFSALIILVILTSI
jgi:uncharacterized membrane protein